MWCPHVTSMSHHAQLGKHPEVPLIMIIGMLSQPCLLCTQIQSKMVSKLSSARIHFLSPSAALRARFRCHHKAYKSQVVILANHLRSRTESQKQPKPNDVCHRSVNPMPSLTCHSAQQVLDHPLQHCYQHLFHFTKVGTTIANCRGVWRRRC